MYQFWDPPELVTLRSRGEFFGDGIDVYLKAVIHFGVLKAAMKGFNPDILKMALDGTFRTAIPPPMLSTQNTAGVPAGSVIQFIGDSWDQLNTPGKKSKKRDAMPEIKDFSQTVMCEGLNGKRHSGNI